MKLNKIMVVCMMIFMIGTLQGCNSRKQNIEATFQYTFRLAESHPDNHPTTIADYEFARLVEEKSDGKIKIIVYPDKTLGEEASVIEQVQFGAIDLARVSVGPLSDYVPKVNVIQLPYLYENNEHMWRVLNSDIGDDFLASVESEGFIGLTFMEAGARSFYTTQTPISNVEDLKGLKIRVMESTMMKDMVEALGAKAIAMPYGEVYQALVTGQIDGAENNWPSYDTSSHYEAASYYAVDEHVRVPEILIASEFIKERLDDEALSILIEAAQETQIYQRNLWEEFSKESQERLTEQGVEIYIIDDRASFQDAMKPVYDKYASDYEELVEKIRQMK